MENKESKQIYGRWGENLAVSYLEKKGYLILERNWRFGKLEIDVIAEKGDIIVFIEVKARKNSDYGFPEESVNRSKQDKILEAAEEYLEINNIEKEIRFDIIAVTGKKGDAALDHFLDAISPYDD